MGRIHVCFAVLLASDDPRTSWSFQPSNVTYVLHLFQMIVESIKVLRLQMLNNRFLHMLHASFITVKC
jgi:hypothetical protein